MELIRRDTDYGIRGLAAMSRMGHEMAGVGEISEEIGVSKDFLYKIFRKLAQVGVLKARRGVNGGFSLTRHPEEITLIEIIECIQGPVRMNRCFRHGNDCPNDSTCAVKPALTILQDHIAETLAKIRLSDVM